MSRSRDLLCIIAAVTAMTITGLPAAHAGTGAPWLREYQPNPQSRKFPVGSAAERRARMAVRARTPAYTQKFDLSGLPHYVPRSSPVGTLRICGNNYIGDSPLGSRWQAAFRKYQPGITIKYDLPTGAIAFSCIYMDKADIGIGHAPGFYDDLSHLRLKGYLPESISVVTGSYNVIGWQNNLVVIVNSKNPLTKVTLRQLDGIFGSERAGGWVRTKWHPEFARGPKENIRTWEQMGLSGAWSGKPIHTYGFAERYSTATEFSDRVLESGDKWNGNILEFGNYQRPDGTTYLESDQVIDHVKNDPGGIGYLRYHDGLPKNVRVLAIAKAAGSPYVPYTINTVQNRTYPLWGQQSFWVSVKPGTKMDPKISEFIRFVLSREGQALVEQDGKFLPLSGTIAAEQRKKLAQLENGTHGR